MPYAPKYVYINICTEIGVLHAIKGDNQRVANIYEEKMTEDDEKDIYSFTLVIVGGSILWLSSVSVVVIKRAIYSIIS